MSRRVGDHFRRKANEVADLMEEFMLESSPTYDENGKLMTKAEVIARTRSTGWKDFARQAGWSESEISRM